MILYFDYIAKIIGIEYCNTFIKKSIGIAIANSFFGRVFVLVLAILYESIVNNPEFITLSVHLCVYSAMRALRGSVCGS